MAGSSARWMLVYLVLTNCGCLFAGGQAPSPSARPSAIDAFLDEKEHQVQLIAHQATINYKNTCDLVATCDSPKNCSRGPCQYVLGDLEKLVCASIKNHTGCQGGNGSKVCDNGLVTYDRSYVRAPINNIGGVPPEVKNAICSQRALDDTVFKSLEKSRTGDEFFNHALGSVEGPYRFYPGRALADCDNYDVRQRPWYNAGIGVKKSLVILMDSSYSMGRIQGAVTTASSFLRICQTTAINLLNTLSATDEASVVTFDNNGTAFQLGAKFTVPPTGLEPDSEELGNLTQAVESLKVSSNRGAANYHAGLSSALSLLEAAPGDAIKVVVVLTDGNFGDSVNVEELNPVLLELGQKQVKVLMYSVGLTSSSAMGNLTKIACTVGGSYEVVANQQNPLFGIRSLFSFFAQAHLSAFPKPYWLGLYTNYDGLGPVTEVTYPVMTMDGLELIGVAGILVQKSSLGEVLQGSIDNALQKRMGGVVVTNPAATGASLSCALPATDPATTCGSGTSTGICPQTDFQHGYTDMACCSSCGGIPAPPPGPNRTANYVGGAVGCAAALVVIVLVFIFRSEIREWCCPGPQIDDVRHVTTTGGETSIGSSPKLKIKEKL